MTGIEIETTLAICSISPEKTVREVAALNGVGPYSLEHCASVQIRDLYMDLGMQTLKSLGLGFRLRNMDGAYSLTLKGKPKSVAGGGVRRDEFELPWSSSALRELVVDLKRRNVELAEPDYPVEPHDPAHVLSDMDFFVEHKRSTVRRPRNVIIKGDDTRMVAELVVDSVEYEFRHGIVRHHEIEIEAKHSGEVADIQAVARELLVRWRDTLRPWNFGKRSTGNALEALFAQGDHPGVVSPSGDLLPGAYDLLLESLR